jgi:glycerophosphoryl diester phosphodiesterase
MAKLFLRRPEDLALIELLAAADVAAAEVWFATVALLARAARAGMPLTTYTLDGMHCAGLSDRAAERDPGRVWGCLRQAGIAAIMTDRPDRLAEYLCPAAP